MSRLVNALKNLIYPDLCLACRARRPHIKEELCRECLDKLPFIKSWADALAALSGKKHFPQNVDRFVSLFYYTKESYVAEMIHYLKYDGLYNVGLYLGGLLEQRHLSKMRSQDYVLVPVPIHPKKLKFRGYNQAEIIARGIAGKSGLEICLDHLIRVSDTKSQTQKSEQDRAKVLEDAFGLNPKSNKSPKNIILVDDVITTGATIAACTKSLLKRPIEQLVVASLGVSI